ncbi:MAG: sigma-70 family RNA polymerase sigma factor [Chloroflexi bacterium]|nr:sigma-70 family RNA polymerase sigma factor [Chloroflexota bacterium]
MTDNKARVPAAKPRSDETWARGNPTEFDVLFLEHWQPIYRALVRLLGDRAEAEDVALDAFWRLYCHPPSRSINLGGWLYRVATNLGLNALRARKRRERHEMRAGRWQAEGNSADGLEVAAAEEERQRVRQVLATMDTHQAELLLLRHSGMAYKELASAVGVSVSSVGTLLGRAEREFEKRYREKGE